MYENQPSTSCDSVKFNQPPSTSNPPCPKIDPGRHRRSDAPPLHPGKEAVPHPESRAAPEASNGRNPQQLTTTTSRDATFKTPTDPGDTTTTGAGTTATDAGTTEHRTGTPSAVLATATLAATGLEAIGRTSGRKSGGTRTGGERPRTASRPHPSPSRKPDRLPRRPPSSS
jgi:hypothetical protein